MACLLAAAPTSFSPSFVKATTDGVVLTPSAFSRTFGVLPSMIATQELVVPRSIPMMAPPFAEENRCLIADLKRCSIEQIVDDKIIKILYLSRINFQFRTPMEDVYVLLLYFKMQEHLQKKRLIQSISSQIDHNIKAIDKLLKKIHPNPSMKSVHLTMGQIDDDQIEIDEPKSFKSLQNFMNLGASGIDPESMYQFQRMIRQNCNQILYEQDGSLMELIRIVNLESDDRMKISVECKHDWIHKYLDQHDCVIQAQIINDQSKEEVIVTSTKQKMFTCRSIKSQKSLVFDNKHFYKWNQTLMVSFPNHKVQYQLKMIKNERKFVYKMKIDEECRVLIKGISRSKQKHMQRIIIFKVKQEGKAFQLFYGMYSKQDFIEAVTMPAGYYIVCELSNNPCLEMSLFFPIDHKVQFYVSTYNALHSFYLMICTFQECSITKEKLEATLENEQIELKSQFLRACYMDCGFIIEIYHNIYSKTVIIQDQEYRPQDKKLLFEELYSSNQITNKYKSKELVIKFFEITEKPAKLYIPKKCVRIGRKKMKNVARHSVFK